MRYIGRKLGKLIELGRRNKKNFSFHFSNIIAIIEEKYAN